MKSLLKKCGAFVCRSLLSIIKSDDKYNFIKIGLLIGTFALYSLVFSWKFAILIMVAIGWHESGHVWAMRRVGVPTRGFYFIPFLGGVAIADRNYANLRDKVIVAIMGPIWGMALGLVTWVAYLLTDNPFLGAAAYWQALLNLFNLLPANPLDGGQIFRSVFSSFGKKVADVFGFVSILAFIVLWWFFKSPVFLFAAYMSGRDFWMYYKQAEADREPPLSRSDLITTIVAYVVLCVTLVVIFVFTAPSGANLNTLYLK
jgi:putative peptide zinc metalloprotease protein